MKKQYLSAPLPFVGQKRMFAREFIKVLKQYPEDTVFVDLFGGSGLLSHITKCQKPDATVIYNDFDGYRNRLQGRNGDEVNVPDLSFLLLQTSEYAVAQFTTDAAVLGYALRFHHFAQVSQKVVGLRDVL